MRASCQVRGEWERVTELHPILAWCLPVDAEGIGQQVGAREYGVLVRRKERREKQAECKSRELRE